MKIEKVKLFSNFEKESRKLAKQLEKKLSDFGYEIVDENYDLAIAIGGDGSYLRMVKDNNFNSDIYYIGVNTGTLGFLQEIKPNEINNFLEKLQCGFYKIESVGIQETTITTTTGTEHFFSLNDIEIREENLKKTKLALYIEDELLEDYTGDGILISTSVGSTAYNLSLGGSIVFANLHTLQITPIAAFNTTAYRNLLNSVVIPSDQKIHIIPNEEPSNLRVAIDGESKLYQNVTEIETSVSQKRINCLRMKDYNATKIIHDKFLK